MLLQWQEKAVQFDQQKRMDQAVEQDIQARQGHRQPPRPTPSSTPNRPSPTVNYPIFHPPPPNNVSTQPRPGTTGPMDIDRNKQSSIKCYNCGVAGHIARQCPRMTERARQARALVQELDPEQREQLRQELNEPQNTEPPPEGFPNAQQ